MDGDIAESLSRIALALERLADVYAPARKAGTGQATLGKACYNDEERERRRLKAELEAKQIEPERIGP